MKKYIARIMVPQNVEIEANDAQEAHNKLTEMIQNTRPDDQPKVLSIIEDRRGQLDLA